MVNLRSKFDHFGETESGRSGTLTDHISGTLRGILDVNRDSDASEAAGRLLLLT